MLKHFHISLVILLILNNPTLQELQFSKCRSKYENYMIGECKEIDECTGASVQGDCNNNSYTCCIEEIGLGYIKESSLISKNLFLKMTGKSKRNEALYNHFVISLEDARIRTSYQAAAYLSQLLGETKLFKYIESTQLENDYNIQLGNNQVGDGIKYRGRGSILLRGKLNYILANKTIPGK